MDSFQEIDLLEVIAHLRKNGFGKLVDTLLNEEAFTVKGRLNKSAISRLMECKPKEVERLIEAAREFLGEA